MRWVVSVEVDTTDERGSTTTQLVTFGVEADRPSQAHELAPALLARSEPELAARSTAMRVVSAIPDELGDRQPNQRLPASSTPSTGQLLDMRAVAGKLRVPVAKVQHALARGQLPTAVTAVNGSPVWSESQLGGLAQSLGVSWPPKQSSKSSKKKR